MKDTVKKYVSRAEKRLSRRKKAGAALLSLSLVVASGVTWSLHQTGQSLTMESYCGLEEHTHEAACVESALVCGAEEHTHTDACYETQSVLTCTETEHTHSAEAGCYDEDGNLICEIPEHTHSDACYTTEQVLVCGEEEHTHTEACYQETYICGYEEEHTHSLACYADLTADVETAATWEKTFADVELTGNAGEDVVAIARTQLGYAESASNYQVETADDGTETAKGYTRYGAWYGDPYGDWCAMFASFCLHYADVDYPTDASCQNWIATLSSPDYDCYVSAANWSPAIGDLVFFDQDGDGVSDHVGIVSELTQDGQTLADDADPATADGIKTIEGNSSDKVAENSYTLNNSTIVGYGELPRDAESENNGDNENNDVMLASEDDTSTDTVTVTFVINNSAYTYDTGSGNTHVVASQEYDSSNGLTYTYKNKVYRVGGTGTLCSYTLESGQSLSDAGYSKPALTITNIGDSNAVEYISSYSWITADGQVINNLYHVFTEDTTLYLQLYEEDEIYYLDFVCGESDNHSISSYTSWSAQCKLGQTIDQWYLDSATTTANESFNSSYCTYKTGSGYTFVKWQLKNTETGEMVDFTSDTPITSEYCDTDNYGNSIKIYAVWEKEPTYTDITFHDMGTDGAQVSQQTLSLTDGETLADALAANGAVWATDNFALSDCVWYTVDDDGTKTPITSTAAEVNSELATNLYTYSYTATFTLKSTTTSNILDMLLSLASVTTDDSGNTVLTITAREGQALAASDFIDSTSGADYSIYTWVDSSGKTVDVASLLKNGLSSNITATVSDSDTASSISTSTGTVNFYVSINEGWVKVTSKTMTGYYLTSSDSSSITTGSYYLTAAQLAEVYGAYGFEASDLTDSSRLFAHCAATDTTGYIYADRAAVKVGDTVYSPILSGTVDCNVWYLPKQTLTTFDYTSNLAAANTFYTVTVTDENNKVYSSKSEIPAMTYNLTGNSATVTVESADDITWYAVGATDGTVVMLTDGTENNSNGTITYTITDSITQAYTVYPRAAGEYTVTYNLNLPETPYDAEYDTPTVGGSTPTYVNTTTNTSYTLLTPSVTSYIYAVDSTKYMGTATFLGWATSADATEAEYEAGQEITLTDDVTLYAVWSTDYASAGNKDGSMVNFFVALTAVPEGSTSWEGSTAENFFTASVYSTDCYVTGTQAKAYKLYKGEIYANEVQYLVLGNTTGTLNELHDEVVNNLTAGYSMTVTDGNTYTYKATFPTDEEVLRNIRTMVSNGTTITINGHKLTTNELTSENFTVKWNVFKYATGDGWHIDGLLIAKTGKMKVTKTFAGDETSIATVLNSGYTINVDGEDGVVHSDDVTLNTNAKTDSNTTGYDNYDSSSNTYTWYVDVDQFYDYTVTENKYDVDNSEVTVNADYNVSNAKTSDQNTTGWKTYTSGVTVTGQTYDTTTGSGLLTVAYRNTYVKAGTLVIQKKDSSTGNLMAGVQFTVKKSGEDSFQLYQQTNKGEAYVGHYTDQSTDDSGNALSAVTGNVITTDANGQAYLAIADGTYTFTEVANGYEDPGTITVTVENGTSGSTKIVKITYANSSNTDANGKSFVDYAEGTLTLNVANTSPTTSLIMKKIWPEGEKEKQVTLQLLRNGESMGSSYQVTLDGTVDNIEKTAWQVTFDNLPLYVDGAAATYSIRETNIGGSTGFYYSDDFNNSTYGNDGYKYYSVTYSDMVYTDAEGNVVDNPAKAKGGNVTLTVTNSTANGEVSFTKTDSKGTALSGATFYLYKLTNSSAPADDSVSINVDANGTSVKTQTLVESNDYTYTASGTSDTSGKVSFGSSLSDGYYYLIEHSAPRGYELDSTVYLIHKDGPDVTISKLVYDEETETSAWVALSANQIVNETKDLTADLTITKKAEGNSGAFLEGAEFTLTNEDGKYYSYDSTNKTVSFVETENSATTLTSDKNGLINVYDLPAGTYTLTETKAPAGYYLLSSTITITVSDDGKITAVTKGTTPLNVTTTQTLDGWDCSFTVTNSAGEELPMTGGAGTTLYTLSGLGLMALALVYGCQLRRRRERRAD